MADKRRTHSDRIEALEDAFTRFAQQEAAVRDYRSTAQSVIDGMKGLCNAFDQAKIAMECQSARLDSLSKRIATLDGDVREVCSKRLETLHMEKVMLEGGMPDLSIMEAEMKRLEDLVVF